MENTYEVNQAVIKYLRQEQLSEAEEAILQELRESEGGRQLLQQMKDVKWVSKQQAQMNELNVQHLWEIIRARLVEQGDLIPQAIAPTVIPVTRHARTRLWRYSVAAAVVVLGGGAYFLTRMHNSAPIEVHIQTSVAVAGQPGGNKAVLTLADGRKISLDSSSNRVIAAQGNTTISQLADGQLAYQKKSIDETTTFVAFNTLATPRAGQFTLNLPDGSKVWLNNASTLRYPVAFTRNNRQVELTGEAYFEVAKDRAKPFKVVVHRGGAGDDGGTVEVLGTAFNIMAYADEQAERTTLVEGRVRFDRKGDRQLLQPMEQAVVTDQGQLQVLAHVDVDEVTAWKNGYFHFDHASLESTMRQLARWYDVDVEYKVPMSGQSFTGKIQRNLPLQDVLKGLANDQFHFVLDGRKLSILP